MRIRVSRTPHVTSFAWRVFVGGHLLTMRHTWREAWQVACELAEAGS